MSRPKTAQLRPATSAGQLNSSIRPATTGGFGIEHERESHGEQEGSYDSKEYTDTEDDDDKVGQHQAEDDDVFAFAPREYRRTM